MMPGDGEVASLEACGAMNLGAPDHRECSGITWEIGVIGVDQRQHGPASWVPQASRYYTYSPSSQTAYRDARIRGKRTI